MINDSMQWQIGLGNYVLFWCDKWLSKLMYESLNIPHYLAKKLMA